jgi:transcriptional regulator PpsR
MRPFADSRDIFATMHPDAVYRLAMLAGDVVLVLDSTGKIVDSAADPKGFPSSESWIGRDWLDTVTIDSRHKVMEMLARARKGQTQNWRHINHAEADGDVPVRYNVINMGDSERYLAVGRDMRDVAVMQQRLIQAQQSLERDYMRLRQVETRYRMLFDMSSEPVLIVESETWRIREANAAAHALLKARDGTLIGAKLPNLFDRSARDPLVGFLSSTLVSRSVSPISVALAGNESEVGLSATGFRQHGQQLHLVRLSAVGGQGDEQPAAMLDIIENMPDAFVMTDEAMTIVTANLAFVELLGFASADQLRGKPLGGFVGRPGIDVDLLVGQVGKYGFVRNVGTVLRTPDGADGEQIEISGVRTSTQIPHYGFVFRQVGRRFRDIDVPTQDFPRSVEQLTELVGRMSLRDIVRESTDLIERLCIEAALSYTSDNRASAAEILGLSRQSLYSKLHRHGLGNLDTESD